MHFGPNKSTEYTMLDFNDYKIKELEFIDAEIYLLIITDDKLLRF